ncbi:MAG: sugar ABC transporter permease [Anaerolineae bacterium]|nr:sugar ABC transporter permease [Anaerolineae bacterium]
MPYLFVLPAFLFFFIFILIPVLNTLRYSFFDWTGFSDAVFVGLSNYRELAADQNFLAGILNNLKFIFFFTALPIAVALALTAALSRRRLWGRNIFRVSFFVSYVMPMVVVGVVWRWIYNPVFGPLNTALKSVGLQTLAKAWLGDFSLAFIAVGIIATWVQYGYCLTLFMAGVQRIDEALYDAAKVDGANAWHQLLHVTIPGIRAEISVALVTTFIAALRVFDLIFVTTRGGPGSETMVTSLWLYTNAFQINRVGYAAAIAVVQTFIILAISYFLLNRSKLQGGTA